MTDFSKYESVFEEVSLFKALPSEVIITLDRPVSLCTLEKLTASVIFGDRGVSPSFPERELLSITVTLNMLDIASFVCIGELFYPLNVLVSAKVCDRFSL